MKSIIRSSLMFALIIALFGCSNEATLDASSSEALEASVKVVVDSLSSEDQAKFGRAYLAIAVKSGMANPYATKEVKTTMLRPYVHGKTAAEIIEVASGL